MSLPSCFKHHPDEESVIAMAMDNGKERRYCKVCMRVRARASYQRAVKRQPTATGHGDLLLPRLDWPASEFMAQNLSTGE